MTWREGAACAEVDPETFFPVEQAPHNYDEARAVCAICPVAETCLDEAMAKEGGTDHRYRHGMLGGLTPKERAAKYRRDRKVVLS